MDKDAEKKGDEELAKKNKKLKKKVIEKDERIKNLELDLQRAKDNQEKQQQMLQQANEQPNFSQQYLDISEQIGKLAGATSEVKNLKFEKEMILAEIRSQLKSNDMHSLTVQQELDRLRESFSKVKVEKESLKLELDKSRQAEEQWRATVDKLKNDIDMMTSKVTAFKSEEGRKLEELSAKDEANRVEVSILRKENLAIKQDNQALFQRVAELEHNLSDRDQQLHALALDQKSAKKSLQDAKSREQQARSESDSLRQLLEEREVQFSKNLGSLEAVLDEVKQSKLSLQVVFESQIEQLRIKLASGGNESAADASIQITQKEAMIKSLKKELGTMKTQLQKLKGKHNEMKAALAELRQAKTTNDKRENPGFLVLLEQA